MEATLAPAEAPAPTESAPVETTPEVELSFDDMAAKSLADARTLLEQPGEEIAEVAEETAKADPAEDTEDDTEENPAPAEEPQSAQARRRLAKEKRLRDDRAAFDAEKAEHAERFEKMEAWESSKAASIEDPVAHLRETGLTDDDLMKTAREIFFTLMPGASEDPASQREMAELRRDRRLAKLERDQAERKAKSEKPPEEGQVTPEYVATYKANLQATAEDFSHEEYPAVAAHVAEIEANGGDGIAEVMSGLWAVATQSAALNRKRGISAADLTPEECMGHVEVWLKAQKDAAEPTPERSDTKPNQTEPAPIRNKQAALKAPKKQPEPLSEEEEQAERMRKAHAMLL